MKLKEHGKNILEVEVSGITKNGIWLFIKGKEYFLPFDEYPWFRKAMVDDIMQVKLLHENHLCWEVLDIDLHLDSLENLEQYPLISQS